MVSVWPLYHKGLNGGVLQRWLFFWKVFPSPQRNSRALSVSIGFLVTSLSKALFLRLLSLARWPALGGSKLLPFNNDGGHCVLGDLQCCRIFVSTFPQICASTQSCLRALQTISSTSWLGFCSDMHCQLWDLILTGVCLSKSCSIK